MIAQRQTELVKCELCISLALQKSYYNQLLNHTVGIYAAAKLVSSNLAFRLH